MLKTKLSVRQITEQSIVKTNNRISSTLLCSFCCYFPLIDELSILPQLSESVRHTKWICPQCNTVNECFTDQFYRCHCPNSETVYVDFNTKNQSQHSLKADKNSTGIALYLQISSCMSQILPGFNIGNNTVILKSKNSQQSNLTHLSQMKRVLMKQSKLLKIYLENVAVLTRQHKGRYFSWDNFLKNTRLTKIQYGLWLIDSLASRLNYSAIYFFTMEDQLSQFQLQRRAINQKMKSEMFQIYPSLRLIKTWNQIQQQLQYQKSIIVTASPLSQFYNKCCQVPIFKAVVVNLQQMKDPVTLLNTSTALHILREINAEEQLPAQLLKQQSVIRSCSAGHTNPNLMFSERKQQKIIIDALSKGSNSKNQNIQIFDWRACLRTSNSKNSNHNKNIRMHLSCIVEMAEQKTREIVIFTKKTSQSTNESSWLRLLSQKFASTKAQTNKKHKQKLQAFKIHNSEKIKIEKIITEFTNLVQKMNYQRNNQILEFINKVISILSYEKNFPKSIQNIDFSLQIKLYLKLYSVEDDLISVLYSNSRGSIKTRDKYERVEQQQRVQFYHQLQLQQQRYDSILCTNSQLVEDHDQDKL